MFQSVYLWSLVGLSVVHLVSGAPTPSPRATCELDFPGFKLQGKSTGDGACRYTVKYGQAARWQDAVRATEQTSKHDTTNLPPACPQAPGGPILQQTPGQDEDCLYAVVYAPSSVKRRDRLPVFIWIHGGSYYSGTASAPGLDGSTLATKGNMTVLIPQYRLGILGLLPPSSSSTANDPNLSVKDVILALEQVQAYAEWIGADRGKVTIGEQSSGASMIRALLAAPRAKGLFRAAILQSDPITYGTAPASTTEQLQDMFYAQIAFAACQDIDCLRRIPVNEVLRGQAAFIAAVPGHIQGVPIVTPLRPTHNTPTLPSESTSQAFSSAYTLSNPPASIPLLITTTANEAGQVVQSLFPQPIPPDNTTYAQVLSVFVGPERAQRIVASDEYRLAKEGDDGFRRTFERLVTDGVWRCASRDFARKWADQGGKVWVGEWTKGVNYVNNQGGGYCSEQGRVCHEDDIFPAFNSAPSPSTDQRALEDEVLSRWTTFIHNLDPNQSPSSPGPSAPGTGPLGGFAIPLLPGGLGSDRGLAKPLTCLKKLLKWQSCKRAPASWPAYTGDVGQVYGLGGGPVMGCPEGYWGEEVRYDWQMYS